MTGKNQIVTAGQLAQQVCANHDHGQCIYGRPCRILRDEPCGYFQRSVLPPAGYKYYPQIKDIAAMRMAYSVIDKHVAVEDVRECGCGNTLSRGRRLCDDCRRSNKRRSSRKYLRKYRRSKLDRCNTKAVDNRQFIAAGPV